MAKIEAIIILILILFGILFITISKDSSQPPPYTPEVDFIVSPTTIDVNDNQTSNLVAVTITKKDTKNIPTKFVLKFKPSNPDYTYAIDAESKEKVEQKDTETLTEYERNFNYQFKVFGKKVSGATYIPWKINIELFYNNTKIGVRTLDVTVK